MSHYPRVHSPEMDFACLEVKRSESSLRRPWIDRTAAVLTSTRNKKMQSGGFSMSLACCIWGVRQQTAGSGQTFFPSYSITRQIRFIFYSLRCKRFVLRITNSPDEWITESLEVCETR
jgi:hypothetical protein